MTALANLAGATLHPLIVPISNRLHELEAKVAEFSPAKSGDGRSEGVEGGGKQFVLVLLDSAQVSGSGAGLFDCCARADERGRGSVRPGRCRRTWATMGGGRRRGQWRI